jgi:hypothetical protein
MGTELEHFVKIYKLGGTIWYVNHDLADERIESTPELEQWLLDCQKEIQALVQDTSLFGVSEPLNENLTATKAYWEWYHRMKKIARDKELI